MEKFAAGYYRVCTWIMRFAYLNLLWICFSIVGLVVFGTFPATIAMFAVVRKWVMGETDIPVFQTFWKSYRTEFLKGNLLCYLLLAVGYFLYLDLQYVRLQEGLLFQILSYSILSLTFLYLVILLYVLPMFVHFNTKTFQYVKWSLIIGVTHPVLTVIMAVALGVTYYIVSTAVPGLFLFFLGSTSAYVISWCSNRVFSAYSAKSFQFNK